MTQSTPSLRRLPVTIAVASGKGGTGKTLLATNLAALVAEGGRRVVLTDCDVEAPNDELFFAADRAERQPVTALVASVDPARCAACGRCRDACAFGAVRVLGKSALVFDELCHGCGICADVCPQGAVTEESRRVGEVRTRTARDIDRLMLVAGSLDVGQVKTPTVIRAARAAAEGMESDVVFLDAPPGVACATVAAVRAADGLVLVTEPTAFGHHDLALGMEVGRSLGLPMAVVVNRVGTGAADIEALCASSGVPIVARVPFDRRIAEVYAAGGLVSSALPEVRAALAGVMEWIDGLAAVEAER